MRPLQRRKVLKSNSYSNPPRTAITIAMGWTRLPSLLSERIEFAVPLRRRYFRTGELAPAAQCLLFPPGCDPITDGSLHLPASRDRRACGGPRIFGLASAIARGRQRRESIKRFSHPLSRTGCTVRPCIRPIALWDVFDRWASATPKQRRREDSNLCTARLTIHSLHIINYISPQDSFFWAQSFRQAR